MVSEPSYPNSGTVVELPYAGNEDLQMVAERADWLADVGYAMITVSWHNPPSQGRLGGALCEEGAAGQGLGPGLRLLRQFRQASPIHHFTMASDKTAFLMQSILGLFK